MIGENYEDEGGYYIQKNIKTGKIIGARGIQGPDLDKN
jgi:hypothetical protein